MSLKGLNLRDQKLRRDYKRKNHADHQRLTKEQRAERRARVEYNSRKEKAYECERTADAVI